MKNRFTAFVLVTLFLATVYPASLTPTSTFAQDTPCGVVDAIDYPLDISDTLERRFDDFARYRQRYSGLHTGFDLAFNRYGEAVHAAARGRVTLADPEEWDTEKGVVIIEHIMPDGRRVYTVYGHVEPHPTYRLPRVGSCVARGDIIGMVGDPSLSLPHLHYEIRNFMAAEGGPGYVLENPLLQGWYHPLEFTQTWRARLTGSVLGSVQFDLIPAVPPIFLDNGLTIIGSGGTLEALVNGVEQWRVATNGSITGLLALSEARIVARSRQLPQNNNVLRGASPAMIFAVPTNTPSNATNAATAVTATPFPSATPTPEPAFSDPQTSSMVTLQNGRYLARWDVTGQDFPFYAINSGGRETLVFVGEDGAINGYDAWGVLQWTIDAPDSVGRITRFDNGGSSIGVAVRISDGYRWRIIDANGVIGYETHLAYPPIATALTNGDWLLLVDGLLEQQILRISGGVAVQTGTLDTLVGLTARMIQDGQANTYVYGREGSLTSLAADGSTRWQVSYREFLESPAPLMSIGGGCILYLLDYDGMFTLINTVDGSMVNQLQWYSGGETNNSPDARILRADAADRVLVGAGFLSIAAVDGRVLAGAAADACRS